jgi:hypothetical protein
MGRILSITMIGLSVSASIGYYMAGDLKRGTYWLAAAIITTTVTL